MDSNNDTSSISSPPSSTALVVHDCQDKPLDPLLLEYIRQHPLQPVPSALIDSAEERLKLVSRVLTHLASSLGRFVHDLPKGIVCCPVYVFEERDWLLTFRHDLNFVDAMEVTKPGIRTHPHGHAGYNSRHAIIGYDCEYVTTEREIGPEEESGTITQDLRMVSNQFYFSIGLEHICVVLVTARRLTQKAFIREFLAHAIPDSMVI